MTELTRELTEVSRTPEVEVRHLIQEIIGVAEEAGYTPVDIDTARPWGGYVRFSYNDAEKFLHEFFPSIDPADARLGNPDAQLSPKFLIVSPGARLSWQVHERRAERWRFLTAGGYHRSTDADDMGVLHEAEEGTEVQFAAGECHRLVGGVGDYTIVAEVWQHTDALYPSDENDITRLQDDYKR